LNIGWLTKRVTREELEADPDGPVRWKTLIDAYQDGDELWEFSSPADYWQNLAGRGGVALVRGGAIVASIVTIMN
jgi:hypothetical protein